MSPRADASPAQGDAQGAQAPQTPVARCPFCGKLNRLAATPTNKAPSCGNCKKPLFPPEPVKGTDANWAQDVDRSPIPVLVDFWAPWCGPCRAVAPVMDKIAAERAGRLKVLKLNVDENPQTAAKFQVQAIPTMILFKDGKVLDQIRGAVPKPALDKRLDHFGI
jgi:thioredoxin 2